jgi:hypothetical protein
VAAVQAAAVAVAALVGADKSPLFDIAYVEYEL